MMGGARSLFHMRFMDIPHFIQMHEAERSDVRKRCKYSGDEAPENVFTLTCTS